MSQANDTIPFPRHGTNKRLSYLILHKTLCDFIEVKVICSRCLKHAFCKMFCSWTDLYGAPEQKILVTHLVTRALHHYCKINQLASVTESKLKPEETKQNCQNIIGTR